MGKKRIIEKTKGMGKEGAIKLLKYHQGLQKLKMNRLGEQMVGANKMFDVLGDEIERREKEDVI